jgi:outer membrane protein
MIFALLSTALLQSPQQSGITLSAAIDRALATHPAVAVSHALRDRVVADRADARATQLPRLSLDASVNQFQEPMIVYPIHSFTPGNLPIFDRTLIQSSVNAGWTAYDFGARSARVRAQTSLLAAADAATTTAERQLIARTVDAYARVLTSRGILAAHDQRIGALGAERDRMRQLIAEGKAARIDQLRVETEWQRAQADRIGANAQADVAEQQFAQLADIPFTTIHVSPFAALTITDSSLATDTTSAMRDRFVASALRSNSELAELQERIEAARAGVGIAKAVGMPELRLSGAYIDRGRAEGDFVGEWQVGVGLTYPIYSGGVRRNAVQRAGADERAAEAQMRIARLNLEHGIDRTLAAYREAYARARALRTLVEQSEEVSRIERLSLTVGSGTQSDFLIAEANLLRARASLVEAQNAAVVARVELARIAGELTKEWLARTVDTRQ